MAATLILALSSSFSSSNEKRFVLHGITHIQTSGNDNNVIKIDQVIERTWNKLNLPSGSCNCDGLRRDLQKTHQASSFRQYFLILKIHGTLSLSECQRRPMLWQPLYCTVLCKEMLLQINTESFSCTYLTPAALQR